MYCRACRQFYVRLQLEQQFFAEATTQAIRLRRAMQRLLRSRPRRGLT